MADTPFSPRHGALGTAQSGEADPELMGLLMDEPMDISQSQIIERQAETIAKLERDVTKGKEYKTLTKVKLKEAAARLKEYRLKVEGLMVEVENAKAEVKKLETDKKRSATLARKKAGEAVDTAALERAGAAAKSAEERALRAENRAKDAEAAAASAKVQIEALKMQLAHVEASKKDTTPPTRSDEHQAKEKEMEEKLGNARREIEALKSQALQMEKEKLAAEKKATTQTDKRLAVEASMSKLKAEVDGMKGQVKTLEREKREAESKMIAQVTQKAKIESTVKELKAEVETLKKQLHDVQEARCLVESKLALVSKQLVAAESAAVKANARAEAMAKTRQDLEKKSNLGDKKTLRQGSCELSDPISLSNPGDFLLSPTKPAELIPNSIPCSADTRIDDPQRNHQIPVQGGTEESTLENQNGHAGLDGSSTVNKFDAISAAIDAELDFSEDEVDEGEPVPEADPLAQDKSLPAESVKIFPSVLDDEIAREIDKELEFSSSDSSDSSSDNELSDDEDCAPDSSLATASLIGQLKESLESDPISAAIDAELASSSDDEEPSLSEQELNQPTSSMDTRTNQGRGVINGQAASVGGSTITHFSVESAAISSSNLPTKAGPAKELQGNNLVAGSGITPTFPPSVRDFDGISAAIDAELESSEDEKMDECTIEHSSNLSAVEELDSSTPNTGDKANAAAVKFAGSTTSVDNSEQPSSTVMSRTLSMSSESSSSSEESNMDIEASTGASTTSIQEGMNFRDALQAKSLAIEPSSQQVGDVNPGSTDTPSSAVLGIAKASEELQALQSAEEEHIRKKNDVTLREKGRGRLIDSDTNKPGVKRPADSDPPADTALGVDATTKKRRLECTLQSVSCSQERVIDHAFKITEAEEDFRKRNEAHESHEPKQFVSPVDSTTHSTSKSNLSRSDVSGDLAPRLVAAFKIACALQEGEKPDGTYVLRTLGVLIKNLAPLVKLSGSSSVEYRSKLIGDTSITKLISILCEEYQMKSVQYATVLDGIIRVYRTPRTRHIVVKSVLVLAAVFEVVFLKTLEMDNVDPDYDKPPEIRECLRRLRDLVVPSRFDTNFAISFNEDLDRRKEMAVANAVSTNSRKPTNISHDKIFLAHVCAFYASICRTLRLEQLSRVLLIDLLKYHPDIRGLYFIQGVVQVHPDVLRREWDSHGHERSSWVRESIIQLLLYVASQSRGKLEAMNGETAVIMLSSIATAIDEPQLLQSSLGFDTHPDEVLGMFMESLWRNCVEVCIRKPIPERISDSVMALELLSSVCGESSMMKYVTVTELSSLCNDCGDDGETIIAVVRMLGAIARGFSHHSRQNKRNGEIHSDVSTVDRVLDWIHELWNSSEPWRTNTKFIDASVREFSDILLLLSTQQEKLHQRDLMLNKLLRIFDWEAMRLLSAPTLRKLRALVTVARGFIA